MIAALDMYDLPEIRQATDVWYAALARGFEAEGLTEVPTGRMRFADESAAWAHPELFFAQICGYPLRKFFAATLRVLGAPCYRAKGCDGPRYRSAVIVQRGAGLDSLEGLRGARFAYNGACSQSGVSALRALLAEHGAGPDFFADTVVSGGHRMSVAMVAAGEADVASVDCVTWALLEKHAPAECTAVEVMDWTPSAPGLPYIVPAERTDDDCRRFRAGIGRALADSAAAAARDALLIDGFAALGDDDYEEIDRLETRAIERGLPSLI